MSIKETADNIITAVGQDNIESISHCATRVRIVPKNSKRMNKLKETDLIKGSLYVDNQFQVFIQLSDIEEVYQEIAKIISK